MLFLVDFPLVYPLMSSTPQPLFKTAQILLNHPSASAEILAGNKCTKSRQILIKTTNSTLCTTKKESYYHAAIQPSALQRLPVACVFSTIFYQISINISIQLWAQIIQISNNTRPTVPKRCTMALFLAAMALDLALLPLEGSSSRLTPILMKCRHRRFVIIPPLSSTLQVSSSKRLFFSKFLAFSVPFWLQILTHKVFVVCMVESLFDVLKLSCFFRYYCGSNFYGPYYHPSSIDCHKYVIWD